MIIVVGGIKGGTGKTTLATNLAAIAAFEGGFEVLLVDADEQRSLTNWVEQREATKTKTPWTTIQLNGTAIHSQLNKLYCNYELIIVDVAGSQNNTVNQRSALTVADLFILPFKPRSFDIWTIGLVNNMIQDVKAVNPQLDCLAVINQGDSKGKDNSDAKEIILESKTLECYENAICHRKAYSNAAAEGLSVIELPKKDNKAIDEIKNFYNHIIEVYHDNANKTRRH